MDAELLQATQHRAGLESRLADRLTLQHVRRATRADHEIGASCEQADAQILVLWTGIRVHCPSSLLTLDSYLIIIIIIVVLL